MALMMVVMVAFLLIGGHHGFRGNHENEKSPPQELQYIQKSDDGAKE